MNTYQAFRYSGAIWENDVICGRGGASNKHKGNMFFRELVAKHRQKYLASNKVEKKLIAKFIVDAIRRIGGRFLKFGQSLEFTDIGDISAMEKTCQALREGLKIRENKKKAKNKDKCLQVTFTESSSSSCSQHTLPSSSTNSCDHNVMGQSQSKHNTTYGKTTSNNPHYNNINSNRQGYLYAQGTQYTNQNQNLEQKIKYNKSVQYIGRCTCKKSSCLKLYCQCFANSVYCSSEDCRCTNCYNSMHYNEMVHQAKKKMAGKCSILQRV